MTTLCYGGQLWVAALCQYAIGKATYTNIIGYTESHLLAGIKYAKGCIVVDGKESIGPFVQCHELWHRTLGFLAVVALSYQSFIDM